MSVSGKTTASRDTLEVCANCGRTIGRLETAHLHGEHVVCAECYTHLNGQPQNRPQPAEARSPADGDQRFITLKCQSCGANLDVYDDMDRFACAYCGSEMIVQRRGSTVALKAVTAAINKVQIGTDKTAAELAIIRLRGEIDELAMKRFRIKKHFLRPFVDNPEAVKIDRQIAQLKQQIQEKEQIANA